MHSQVGHLKVHFFTMKVTMNKGFTIKSLTVQVQSPSGVHKKGEGYPKTRERTRWVKDVGATHRLLFYPL